MLEPLSLLPNRSSAAGVIAGQLDCTVVGVGTGDGSVERSFEVRASARPKLMVKRRILKSTVMLGENYWSLAFRHASNGIGK